MVFQACPQIPWLRLGGVGSIDAFIEEGEKTLATHVGLFSLNLGADKTLAGSCSVLSSFQHLSNVMVESWRYWRYWTGDQLPLPSAQSEVGHLCHLGLRQ